MKKDYYITSGEFARLCGTTKETLFHYDRSGILKPAHVGENGYRYYTPVQFYDFDLIQTLQYTGSSLKDIRKCFENFDTLYFLEMFRERQRGIEEKRRELEEKAKLMQELIQMTEEALTAKYDVPQKEWSQKEYLLVTPLEGAEGYSDHAVARLLGEHIRKCEAYGVSSHVSVGSIIPYEAICQGRDEDAYFFTKIEKDVLESGKIEKKDLREKPAGLCAAMTHRGTWKSLEGGIQKLLCYVEREGFSVCGDGYIYDMLSYLAGAGEEDYVVKIKVPVARI